MIDRLNAALSGRYRVERELGQGGMAWVYLAHDLKHDRQVALKVLKPELSAVVGAERFLAEIKTTANLQHPNILPLFDSGEAGGSLFYVMPLIEGESLREKIEREGELHVDEAVRLTCEVAEALQAAHEAGVIHRDVKPANILLSRGRPLIADFGIALAISQVGGGRLTETGLSLGTPYYMSPEQASGERAPTAASDVYALGCVLYEMLTGKPPFTATSAQGVLGKILLGSPTRPTELRPTIPANVEGAILKALERLPADRFDTADDFARALRDSSFRYGVEAASVGADVRTWKAAAGMVGAIAVALAAALTWNSLHPPPSPPVSRSILGFAPGQEPWDLTSTTLALAPDGSFIVYVGPGEGSSQLWVKRRAESTAVPLAGTTSARSPSVSPDGEWVAYHVTGPGGAGSQLRKSSLSGGAAIPLADSVAGFSTSPAWLANETVVYLDVNYNLRAVPTAGGVSDVLFSKPRGLHLTNPRVLPGSRAILFGVCDDGTLCQEGNEVWVLDLESGDAHSVVAGAVAAEYAPTGHLVIIRDDGSVAAAPFDLRSLQTTGAEVPVLQGVKVDGVPDFALSPDGTLLMMTGTSARSAEFVWMTRDGASVPVHAGWTFDPGDASYGWSLSPDRTRLAARIQREGEYGTDIWIKELPGGPLSRLAPAGPENRKPRWAPDGASVTFLSIRGGDLGVWTTRADGVGQPSLLYEHDHVLADGFWTPDGTRLVLRTGGSSGGEGDRDILAVRPGVDSAATPLLTEAYDEVAPAISRDSRWIAYASRETGRWEVFVRPFPDVGEGKWQVSTEGGHEPLWAHNRRELFFIDAQRNVVAASVETEPRFRVVERTVLFHLGPEYWASGWGGTYDITADDQRFLLVRSARSEEAVQTRIILVQNWFEELKATLGDARGGR
jgi:eukaryotic-like serine/threonine-protein kinase